MTPPTSTESSLPDALRHLNALARRGAVSDDVSGLQVDDPYRSLESESPDTTRWITAQTERTERALAPFRDPGSEARLAQLLSIGSIDDVAIGGERVFFTMREGERQRPALFSVETSRAASSQHAPALLVDPASYGQNAALDYIAASHDGRFVAFGISDNGDERATLRVFDVAKGSVLADTIKHAKWSSLEWLHDGTGFFYTRYPKAGEPDYDASVEDTYFSRLFFHRIGSDESSDVLVFSGKERTDFPSATVDETDRYVVFTNFRSWTASDVWLWDRGANVKARKVAPAASELVRVIADEDKVTLGVVRGGMLYLLTNLDAPRKRIARVKPSHASERARWQSLVPESAAAIEDVAFTSSLLVVHAIDDIRSKLSLFTADGRALGEVELPTRGSVDGLSATSDGKQLAFVFGSYFVPDTLFTYDVAARELTQRHQVQNDLDTSALTLSRAKVRSKDGTQINVSYIHKKDMRADGDNPVLLTGYGGFDVSLLPALSRSALYFVERGGIFAQANLRGGGELGEEFHRAGMLQNKERVFEDFEAVIHWLTASKLSRPARIAITGGSNGGLLMGAMITRIPESFAAAASYVGLYDMLRYPLFPPAALWTSEYGDPKDPVAARYLHAYSPYHRVRDGGSFPSVLIETADHDTRVSFVHSTKFAARLQEAQRGSRPIYFFMERDVGHGRGTGLSDLIRRESRKYAFLSQALELIR